MRGVCFRLCLAGDVENGSAGSAKNRHIKMGGDSQAMSNPEDSRSLTVGVRRAGIRPAARSKTTVQAQIFYLQSNLLVSSHSLRQRSLYCCCKAIQCAFIPGLFHQRCCQWDPFFPASSSARCCYFSLPRFNVLKQEYLFITR